jgi:hypothetical protein
VSEYNGNRVSIFNLNGKFIKYIGESLAFRQCWGIAYYQGYLYANSFATNEVVVMDAETGEQAIRVSGNGVNGPCGNYIYLNKWRNGSRFQ